MSKDFFAANYTEARQKFLAAATARGCTLTAHLNPHAKGPNGEDLNVDVAVAGPAGGKVGLLLISGTHGVEAYAGSACQVGWLKNNRNDAWPPELKVVMIHALNPYGFAWNRRVTEDNVDLNRNFVDHSAPYPTNGGYEQLKLAIAPPDLGAETLRRGSELFRDFIKEYGPFTMQEAVSKGQYAHPDGMYFGGNREQWSAGIVKHVVRRELAHCRRVGVIDFHTGLGPYGHGELISEESPETPAYARAKAWWPDICSTQAGDSVSAAVLGSIDSCIPGLLLRSDVAMACLEFGTVSTFEVFMALRADNWLHTLGDPKGPEAAEIKAQIRGAFYPDRDDWKDMIWRRGEAVMSQAIAGLTAP
ncbi:MAG: M14 family metallopeptidase [Alphaproteobacteria bacterium]|nr:M14 family metallopeptidase [Alphaproteobacteria bacterium]